MRKTLRDVDPASGEGAFKIDKVAQDLAATLAVELGLEPRVAVAEAFDVLFVIGIPVPELSGQKLAQWAAQHWKARRAAVLTELSREYLGALDPLEEYAVLVHNCYGGTSPE